MEDKNVTPQEELNNIEKILAQLSNRLTAYALAEEFKNARGALQQGAVRALEARHWTLNAIGLLFSEKSEEKVEGQPEQDNKESKKEVEDEPVNEN